MQAHVLHNLIEGSTRIYVEDQTHFKVGKIIIICELFMAQVTGSDHLCLIDHWIEIILLDHSLER